MKAGIYKTKIKKNDTVIVNSGKNLGKKGRVLVVMPEKGKVIVEGVNFVKKHMRPSQKNPQGGIIEIEAALNLSNVQLLCKTCNRGVRSGVKVLDNGTKIRYCKRCGETV